MNPLWKYFHTVRICFSAFYKTKLLSWILTLVNFASERNKTVFSGGTGREAWERPTPLFSDQPKGPQGQADSLTPPPPPPHLISWSRWSGPPTISSSFVSSLVPDPIFYIRSTTSGILRWSLYLGQFWLTQDKTAIKCPGKVLAQNYYHKLE